MHIDWAIVLASVIVGSTVGLIGMSTGALMMPILVIFFAINPSTAVSSDQVASMIMKSVGGGVHIRRGTVRWGLVKWLCVGSISIFLGAVSAVSSGARLFSKAPDGLIRPALLFVRSATALKLLHMPTTLGGTLLLFTWMAPIGIGFGIAVAYFLKTRPQLTAAAAPVVATETVRA